MKIALEKGVLVIALAGSIGGKIYEFADILLNIT